MASKWDIRKKNDKYWQITPTPDDDMLWPAVGILIILFLFLKYPVILQQAQTYLNSFFDYLNEI